MTLNQLITFRLLPAASISASRPLNLTSLSRPLSHSISNLERNSGSFCLSGKAARSPLTKYGKIFLEHTDRILDDVRLAEKHMKKLSGNSGHVDIAYVFPLAARYIPHTVRRFLAGNNNENISFSFRQTYTAEMVARTEIRAVRRHLRFLCGK